MPKLHIDSALCSGCGLCQSACAFGAIAVAGKRAVVAQSRCILCQGCIGACPRKAIALEAEKPDSVDSVHHKGVWVFGEMKDGNPHPVTQELLGKGRSLADDLGCKLTVAVPGLDAARYSKTLIQAGADEVLLCESPSLAQKLEEPFAELLAREIGERRPEIVLIGATPFGRSLAPRIAAKLNTGLTADCTELAVDPETRLLLQTRPAFGGNLMATIVTKNHRPQMATVRPGVMAPATLNSDRRGTVRHAEYDVAYSAVQLLQRIQEQTDSDLSAAQVVVCAGRGIGEKKNLRLVRQLAQALGGTYGVTRPLVDLGWSDQSRQIGQTGWSVRPKLLISCGVSGAVQHLAGIGGTEMVIAINNNENAPIFSAAHYRVVGDCVEILEQMLLELKARHN